MAVPNGIDIEVSRHHHMVSVSNFQRIKVSTDDWIVHFSIIPGLTHALNFLYSWFNYFFLNIISSLSLYKLELQRKYRASNTISVS